MGCFRCLRVCRVVNFLCRTFPPCGVHSFKKGPHHACELRRLPPSFLQHTASGVVQSTMHVAASAPRSFPAQSPLQAAALDGSLALLRELLAASDMSLEEGFCAFAFGDGDGDFDVEHRMTYDQFAAVAIGHLASRLSESAIAALFHEGLDLNGDGFVDGGEWLCALHTMQWLHTMHTMQQAAIISDEPHGSNVKSTIQLQQQGPSPSLGLQLNGGAAAALMCDSHVMSSDHSVSLNEGGAVGMDSMSAERHRHTPVWLDERQHTKEGMQAYLHVRCKGLAVAVCVCACVRVGGWVGGGLSV